MNEMTKTLSFGAVALVSALVAFASRPASVTVRPESEVGKPLFADFTDPLAAKSLRIVRFEEAVSEVNEIEVRENNGIWTLPSHENYPADAANRIRDAVTPFVDLKVTDVVSEKESDHALYGVIEPGEGKSSVGAQGVGTLVNVKNQDGKDLVNLIIGKADKKIPELRFVRRPGQRHVFMAKVDPAKLPTKFEEWIERDLLKLNAWDISQLMLKDYSFQVSAGLRGPIPDYDQRLELTLSDENGKWNLDDMKVAGADGLTPTALKENEELNLERINGLKDALDQLEIVDVERKPTGLGDDLRADQGFFNDETGVDSLLQKGFYPVQMGRGEDQVELLSSDGEVLVRTKEGVEYVLRFGRVQGVESGSSEGKLNRYLLVSARVHEGHFPEPELELVPQTIEDLKSSAAPPTSPATPPADATPQSSVDPRSSHTQLVAFQQPEEAANSEVTDPATAETEATEGAEVAEPAETEANAETEATAETEPAAPAETSAEATETPATESAGSADNPVSQVAAPAEPASTPEEDQKRLQAEQERIIKENQRKQDERKANIAKAQKKVNELNYRFADWYYVISEDVYKKIHLSQVDIVKEKEAAAKEEGFGVDALRGLEPQPSFNP